MKKKSQRIRNRWAITDQMFFSLFLTGSIIEFSQVGAGFIDGLVIGRFLGSEALAADGIAHPIFSILGIISGLMAVGMQVRCSQEIGRGNRKEIPRLFSVTIYVGAALSLFFMLLFLTFAKPIAVLLGASGNGAALLDSAADYLRGVGLGIPAIIMAALLAPAIQMDSGSKTVQIGALIETVCNVIMDIAAVYFQLGLFGIGLATAVSRYLNLLYQCTHFLRRDRMLRFVKPDVPLREFVQMLGNGSENAIKRLANTIRPIILNGIIISYGGAAAMSALSVRNNFSDFAAIFGAGIASAVSMLVSLYYGEINEEAIEEVESFKGKMILWFSGGIFLLLLVFARPIARLYIVEDEEILKMATFSIRMLALQNPLQALVASRIKYLQAVHRKINMNLLIFASKLIFVVLSAYALGRLFGVYGILASYTASDAASLAAVYVFYIWKHRRLQITKNDLLNLPEEFHLNPGNVISLDIRDAEDVSLCSEQISLFCKGHKIDKEIAYFGALCFEELAMDIIENGFPKNHSGEPMIDLRVVATEESFVIRMRDNCPQHDVTELFAAANAENADLTKNIGIRIVSKTVSDIRYLHAFETNNIILRFALTK